MAEKELFGLNLNGSPDLSKRIAYGEVGSVDENMTLDQFLDLVTTNLDVFTQEQISTLFENYLSKTNLTAYSPTEDYHPSTRKFVVDGGVVVPWADMTGTTNSTVIYAKIAQSNNHVIGTVKFTLNTGGDGVEILNIPTTIGTSSIDIYCSGGDPDNEASGAFKITSGTRIIKTDGPVDGNRTYMFNFSYFTF